MKAISSHSSDYSEEGRWHLYSKSDCADGEYTKRKRESPPAHIELKRLALINACEGEYQPNKPETPHNQSYEETEDVRHVTGDIVQHFRLSKICARSSSKIYNAGRTVRSGRLNE